MLVSQLSAQPANSACQMKNRWQIVCGLFQVSARFKPDSEP